MSAIVICVICGDSWEVPDEAYPDGGETICDICSGDDESIRDIGEPGEYDWDDLDDLNDLDDPDELKGI